MGFIRSAVKGTDGFLAEEHELIYILERPVHFAENQIQRDKKRSRDPRGHFGSAAKDTGGLGLEQQG